MYAIGALLLLSAVMIAYLVNRWGNKMSRTNQKTRFNEKMMLIVSVPLILSWIIFACYIIYAGLNDETGRVNENLDFYVSLIAIIGGPALLFINSILEAWKSENTAVISFMPDQLKAEQDKTQAMHEHTLKLEEMRVAHEHEMAKSAQDHAQALELKNKK